MKPRPITPDEWQAAQQRAATAPKGARIIAAADLRKVTHAAMEQHLKATKPKGRRKGSVFA